MHRLAGILAAMALVLGFTAAAPASATAQSMPQTTTLRYGLTPAGVWVPLNDAAAQTTSATPINNWQYFPPVVGDPICLKDYTPETSWWAPVYAASDWSKISYGFHMYYDDMNGAGDNCGSYDNTESVNMYSYDDPGGYCSIADLDIGATNRYVQRATVWLNRGNAPYACDGTATRRTHVMKSAVGYAIGIAYHNIYNDSIMSVADASRATIATVRPTDINAGNCQYGGVSC